MTTYNLYLDNYKWQTEKKADFQIGIDLYSEDVKNISWYNKKLETDLENEIKQRKIMAGRLLDLGTGLGTQEIQLAKMGFEVTGTDVSENAIHKAQRLDDSINFMVDDILNSRLGKSIFDYILDGGCFHVLSNNA